VLQEHQNENQNLRQRLEEIKSEDSKTKMKLKEAAIVIFVCFFSLSSDLQFSFQFLTTVHLTIIGFFPSIIFMNCRKAQPSLVFPKILR